MQPVKYVLHYSFLCIVNATISMWLLLHVLSTRGTSNISLALKGIYVIGALHFWHTALCLHYIPPHTQRQTQINRELCNETLSNKCS